MYTAHGRAVTCSRTASNKDQLVKNVRRRARKNAWRAYAYMYFIYLLPQESFFFFVIFYRNKYVRYVTFDHICDVYVYNYEGSIYTSIYIIYVFCIVIYHILYCCLKYTYINYIIDVRHGLLGQPGQVWLNSIWPSGIPSPALAQ